MTVRRIINGALALGFASTLAIAGTAPVKAQGVHLNGSNIDIQVGRNRDRHDWNGPRRYFDYSPDRDSYDRCPPRYMIQDGICRPFRGH